MRKKIWVDPEFMNWDHWSEGGTMVDPLEGERAYEIWEHAQKRLQDNLSEMDRTDAITTLKRCLNQRLQAMETHYELRKIFGTSSKKYLQLLEELSLIRPLLLQGLMEIRNEIEHKDKRPPDLERCLELLDIVWYFLRTTDRIVQTIGDGLYYEHGVFWLALRIKIKEKWSFELTGWAPKELIALQPTSGFIEVFAKEFSTTYKWRGAVEFGRKEDSGFCISGKVIAFPDQLKVIKQYFDENKQRYFSIL